MVAKINITISAIPFFIVHDFYLRIKQFPQGVTIAILLL